MAFYSYPFESQNTGTAEQPVYDRAITAENERQFNKLRYTNGVFIESSLDDDLQVVPGNGMAVKVSKGGCHIEGALAYNDNDVTLSLEAANATLRRIDRVVARFNTSTSVRSIMVYVKTGTNAPNPVAPALQHESNFWEIGLADITIPAGATSISASNILDTRMDDNLCGRVLPAIPYITQLGSLYEQYQELVNSALSGTVAGQLEARIAAEESKVQSIAKGGTGATTAEAALKALLENKALPIAQGGTGATTAANALKALGGVSIKKVWSNASPTSNFNAQTLPLNLSDADLIIYQACYSMVTTNVIESTIVAPNSRIITRVLAAAVYSNVGYSTRIIDFESSQIVFEDNNLKQINTATGGTKNNKYNIPLAVYKVKGVQ